MRNRLGFWDVHGGLHNLVCDQFTLSTVLVRLSSLRDVCISCYCSNRNFSASLVPSQTLLPFVVYINTSYYILASCCTVLFNRFLRLCCRLHADGNIASKTYWLRHLFISLHLHEVVSSLVMPRNSRYRSSVLCLFILWNSLLNGFQTFILLWLALYCWRFIGSFI
jgi:hypothetical protein